MSKIPCLVVDDEPLALDLIESYVAQTPFLELKGRCSSPFQAMEIMQEQPIQLLFLDIQMPGLTGLDFTKSLANGPRVIFTTAYGQYALEGFKVDAIDYLLKPFNYSEFLRAATKAKAWFDLLESSTTKQEKEEPAVDSIFVKSEYKLVRIDLGSILYVEGLKDYVKIYTTTDSKPIMSLMSLKSLEERLPVADFMRVHRSYIVNLKKVTTIERSRIVFGKEYIPIADGYKERFQQFLDKRL